MNHILYGIDEVGAALSAEVFAGDLQSTIRTLVTDSRKITDTQHALFFALKGRRDGHLFIDDSYKAGVRNFVISDTEFERSPYADANFFLVHDTLQALQDLAGHHRRKFKYPVIGITGSNGKTIVKEWLYQLLAAENNIVRSPKSYNSQVGVPLSVWEMNEENDLAIFEAGISRKGEMDILEKVIKPTIGILTNIREAHNEGFDSIDEKIEEKLKLFKDSDLFIYSPKYTDDYTGELPGKDKFTWSYRDKADLEVFDDEVLEDKFQFLRARFEGEDIQCVIPFTDFASIENGISCWAALLAMGYDAEVIDKRLEKLQPVQMRLELKNGINNCSIIDDSYSSDVSSLAIALDFLKQQNQHLRRTLILSDIPGADELVYDTVAPLLENKSVDRLIGVGQRISGFRDKFSIESYFYESTEDLLNDISSLKLGNETILIKGARSFEFERISRLLTQKVHETVLEINLNALEFNLNYYKSNLAPGTKVMAMVKAFSYGSGSFEIANLLQFNKVDYLAVAYADEGVALRHAGITMPIMVMSPDVRAFEVMIENKLEPEIYSFRILNELEEVLNRKGLKKYPVHIKFDTGMHRLGFIAEETDQLLNQIKGADTMQVASVFSHMVASDDSRHDDFTRRQLADFEAITRKISNGLEYSFLKHIANTSAITRWQGAQLDMVRLGIGMYGIDSPNINSPLQTVTSLKTSISQIRVLQAGETVGYSRMGKLERESKIATVKIGYADGYPRALGNGVGKMLINGKMAPTIGNICMDMCMLDITGINAEEGDEVLCFGEQIRVEQIADACNTIPYEIITGISQRVRRVYFYE